MDTYKKTLYNKKFSNDLNMGGFQSRRGPWLYTFSSCILLHHFITLLYYFFRTRLLKCNLLSEKLDHSGTSGVFDARMLLWYFFEEVQFVLHWGENQIILTFLIVLWFFLYAASGTLWSLRSFVYLLVFMLKFAIFLAFAHLCSLEIARCNNGFASPTVFSSNHGEFKIVSFIHFWIFGSFSNGCSG